MASTPAFPVPVEGQDEEVAFRVGRGADLLATGNLEAALDSLSRARELHPKDPQVLGLLGQTLYKLGRYAEAVEAYATLVEESPVEAAARVNLGLASLKARRHGDAVRQLEIALDLNPEHRKAMGYLGLAWLEQGDFARAREWFERAGSEQMVAKCDELLALATAAPEPGAASDDAGPAPATPPAFAELAAARRVPDSAGEVFSARDGLLVVATAREVLVRGQGLLAVRGAVKLAPELKRFRGRATDRPFGEGASRVLRATGEGSVVLRPAAAQLTVLRLAEDAGYFREEALSGFEGGLGFENGRVAGPAGVDLNLVHLRGSGDVLLGTRGPLRAIEVSAGRPVRVAMTALVGFAGALTPRLIALHGDGAPAPLGPWVVELAGSGHVLVDEGAAA